jgi:ketosteroid isomerase-like protein
VSQENVQLVREIYEAVAARDIPGFLGRLAANVEWLAPESLPWGGTHRGPEAVGQEYFAGFLARVDDDFRLEAEELYDAGDSVAVAARLTAHARNGGTPFQTPAIQIWTISDGKVSRMRYLVDTAVVLKAIEGQPAG